MVVKLHLFLLLVILGITAHAQLSEVPLGEALHTECPGKPDCTCLVVVKCPSTYPNNMDHKHYCPKKIQKCCCKKP